MKNVLVFLVLGSLSIPVLGMQPLANACMLYAAPTKQDAYTALLQGGLVATRMASCHPKVIPYVDSARHAAFIVPALVAWNSESIKNGIMKQLPEFDAPVSYCLETGIKNTLLYGGALAAGYLLYTQTWQGLTKSGLGSIFKPQIQQSKRVTQLAKTNNLNAVRIKQKAQDLCAQIEHNMNEHYELERSAEQQHTHIAAITAKLQKNDTAYSQILVQLKKFVYEIKIHELTTQVATLEQKCATDASKHSRDLRGIGQQAESNQKEFLDQLRDTNDALSIKYRTFKTLIGSVDEDIHELIKAVVTYTEALYASKKLTKIALEYAERIAAAIKERAEIMSDTSDSELESDTEHEDDQAALNPRGIGSSKQK